MAKFSSEQIHHPGAQKKSTFVVSGNESDDDDIEIEDDDLEIEIVDDEDDSEAAKVAAEEELTGDEELEKFSTGVQKRIGKEVGRRHEAERARARAEQDKEDAIAFAQKVAKENADLMRTSVQVQRTAVDVTTASLEQSVNNVKARLQTAMDEGDTKAAVDLQTQLNEVQANLREAKAAGERVKAAEEEVEKAPKQETQPQRPQQQEVQLTPLQEQFFEENKSWFQIEAGTGRPLNSATEDALRLNVRLIKEEGLDPSTPEFYSEINRRLAVIHPNAGIPVKEKNSKPNKGEAPPPKPSFGRSAPAAKTKDGKVVLSRRVMDQIDRLCPAGTDKKEFVKRYLKNMEK